MSIHQPITISQRDRLVKKYIILEGIANLLVLMLKLLVGLFTGSLAVLGDAVHSLTDVSNNVIAWNIVRISTQPADREHPYGHRKFETLAVFGLASFLAVLALELALHAVRREAVEIISETWWLLLMLCVLAVNIAIASWQSYWAKRLDSDLLMADAKHTFADVLTTVVVIVGWQISARGYPWLDTLCALGVSVIILYFAYGLFKKALPVLVDEISIEPELLIETAKKVKGIHTVKRVRSRWSGASKLVDLVIEVDPQISVTEAHDIADLLEQELKRQLNIRDVSIHIEPKQSDL